VGFLRWIGIGLCWGTLLLIIGVAIGGLVVYARINNEVQKHIIAELQKRYPDLKIQVGSAQIVENRGLTIKDIEFSVPRPVGQPLKLLRIGELQIECPVTLQSLYQKNPKISRIVIKDPILRASRSPMGTFPELQFLADGGDSQFLFPDDGKPVLVEIENGTLLYDDVQQPDPPLRFSGINLALTPEILDQTQRIVLKGTTDGDFFRRLTFEAEILPETKQWTFAAHCQQFDWSDDFWQYIPSSVTQQRSLSQRPLFQGRFDFKVSAISDAAADRGYRFAIVGALSHGRLDFPQINRTLTELTTRFEITNDKIKIDNLTGNGDSARFAASFVQELQRAELTVNVRELRFDEELVEVLSPFLNDETERLLAQYDYEGMTDLHAQLSCRNGVWHPNNLSMQISELAFAHHAFPYRLDRLAGNLYIDETATLRFCFKSKQDTPSKMEIDGHYTNIFVDAAGKVEIIGESVPIDNKLVRVFPPSTQQVVNSLQPTGKLNARLIFELPPGDVPVNKQFDIALDRVALRYDHFPYSLRDVTGSLHSNGHEWQFRDISGTNGTALVKGNGYLQPIGSVPNEAQKFVLHISADELPIDDQITNALLNPEQRQLLQSLNVNGKVDLLAQIQYRTDDRKINLRFLVDPRAGLSLCPDRFPYKIENVEGKIHYENGHVLSENLKGTHRDTKLQSGLDCRFDTEGQSVLTLKSLAIDQLQADRELLDALPKHVRDFLESMQITKPFNLSGGMEYRQTAQGEQIVSWGLNWILHQNGAKLGAPVENIFGIVQLTGQSAANRLWLNGELYLDSLMAHGFQATSIRGPFSFDGTRLKLGTAADRLKPDVPARSLMGNFCGGTIRADGLVVLGNEITYDISADLVGANLAQIAREFEPTVQKTSGTLNCIDLQLRGSGTKWETVGGTGKLQVREANMYEAPVMVRLLRELRIREIDPKAGMFSSVDVDFQLSGMQMFFDPVFFEGGAITLHGDGMMRLDNRHIDLTMKTRLGNRRMQIPLVSDIIGGAGDQLVQLKITGPFTDPTVTRVVVPEIQKVIQQMQPEDAPSQPPVSRNRFAPSKMFQWNPL